ncbi:MAG: peptidyl-prolyl cis-trans isomerase, partial [Planctomycetes bacterium]|nr:peptidyl-prolyl cis-trans isomerase [Planctomycetota bacterium]
ATMAEAADDQALRYVNGEVITVSDVKMRTSERLSDYEHKGKVTPKSDAEMVPFLRESLEQLTDEALLVQKAKEQKMVPDHDRVVLEVLERAKELGRDLTLRAQAEARRDLERQQSIDYLLTYYYGNRTPEATPQALRAAYDARQGEFHRPPRARILQIILRPSDRDLDRDLRRAKTDLLKRAQDAKDPSIAQAATGRLTAYLAEGTTRADQDRLLDEFIAEVAQAASRDDLDDASRAMARQAETVRAKGAEIRDAEQTAQALAALRAELDGKGEEAFRAAARRVSQGPNASEGGEQGWVEPGYYPQEFDQRVFALDAGAISEVFTVNQAACLVYILERQEARLRGFPEVSGELELILQRERREQMRRQVVSILRAKASITDLVPIASLLE